MFLRNTILGAVASLGILALPAAASAQVNCGQVASANAFRGALCNIIVDIQIVQLDRQLLRVVTRPVVDPVTVALVRLDLRANIQQLRTDVISAIALINSRRFGRA